MTSVESPMLQNPGMWTADQFREVYEAYGPRLLRFCFHLTGCRDTAEDLTVETLAAAFQGRSRFRGGSRVETWLFGIAHNRYKLWCRKAGPRSESLEGVEASYQPNWIQDMALAEALGTLPRSLLIPLVLVKGEGLSHREAAEILSLPTGTVQFRVFQAVRQLREFLGEEGFRRDINEMRCKSEL